MPQDSGKIKVSATAASLLRPDAARGEKLDAALGKTTLPPHELVTVLFFLYHERDQEIKRAALATLRYLPEVVLLGLLTHPDLHPRILDFLARIHYARPSVAEKIALHKNINRETLAFLAEHGIVAASDLSPQLLEEPAEEEQPTDEEAQKEEETEEFKSKYKMSQSMGVAEKIKMALTGDKEWRSIFIKDANKLVSGSAIKNPRITDAEVLAIAKSAIQNDEIMRVICANKEWTKNYNIRKALVENNKTPLPNALRFLATLGEKDVAAISKSKNVSSVLANQARRMIANKNKKG